MHAAKLLRHHIANTVDEARKSLQLQSVGTFVAVGGDARLVASQVGLPMAEGRLEAITADELEKFLAQNVPATTEEITRRFQLPFAHAETLVPALLVYQALLNSTRARQYSSPGSPCAMACCSMFPRYFSGQEDPALARAVCGPVSGQLRSEAARIRCRARRARRLDRPAPLR